MAENSTSGPLPPSADDHQKVISDFLDSSDWSEQLRVARQKREEVLARKAQEKLAAAKVDPGGDAPRVPAKASGKPPDLMSDFFATPQPVVDNQATVAAAPAAQNPLAYSPFQKLPALGTIGTTAGNRAASDTVGPKQLPVKAYLPDAAVLAGVTKPHTLRQARRASVLQRGLFGLAIGILAGFGIGWLLQTISATNPVQTAQSGAVASRDANPTPTLLAGSATLSSDTAPILPSADPGPGRADFARRQARLASAAAADAAPGTLSAPAPMPPFAPPPTNTRPAEILDAPPMAVQERSRFKLPGPFPRLAEPQDIVRDSPADQRAVADLPQDGVAAPSTSPTLSAPAEVEAQPVLAAQEVAVAQIRRAEGLTAPPKPEAQPAISTDPVLLPAASYTVILHVAGNDSGTRARAELAQFGVVNARTVPTRFKPARAMVAYYDAQDAAVARQFAGLYDGAVLDLTGFTPAPPARTVEIYLTD
ncbi:MAG: hypothetical protein H7317_11100 [Pseudorhodobacter sp.]|nr:hypothetical protein [Pseudorhodobacter sp.]